MDLNSSFLIVGLGKSGLAAVEVLTKNYACNVSVTDKKTIEDFNENVQKLLNEEKVKFMTESEASVNIDKFDVIIKSPGVFMDNVVITAAMNQGKVVYDELELGYQLLKKKLKRPEDRIIAITGTNGKTTTTELVGEILRSDNKRVHVAGNVGVPLTKVVPFATNDDYFVLEVSSFQLENLDKFKPKVSAILNITPDHLDWHGSFEKYLESKKKIFINQDQNDFLVVNKDDKVIQSVDSTTKARAISFSKNKDINVGTYTWDNQLMYKNGGELISIMPINEITLPGEHNLENVLAATAISLTLEVNTYSLRNTLSSFLGVSHRLELVSEISEVKYINDSKGTNVEASLRAINAFRSPIILIAGGKDKGADFRDFAKEIKINNVKYVILLGETSSRISEVLEKEGFNSYIHVDNMEEAVEVSYNSSSAGDVVLLSPACASWDMYDSYEKRGEHFKNLVLSFGGE
ncbi:UDP-N-acetylmuramoyl-L-alanine--D-glutamate ligase [Natranaerobius trueperi]|uniref:UDP-N-acetylmuramoylalanine--D-glutamate ligase n=1 Tax=Natranaerobius trueperi TaxID=759412 RepID=A0A226C103_9FIRM|nr:UDP-N-acetylmuramoyl-L-alanine--D-glutamate ligase [Natranaerobius trueperi]OWZ84129.1 UDP-N-acetylmuramoyl-L-alanine--D-glutamate ligase [Natranaerobius trueperi]